MSEGKFECVMQGRFARLLVRILARELESSQAFVCLSLIFHARRSKPLLVFLPGTPVFPFPLG